MTIDIYNPEKKTTNLEEGRKWEVERYKKEGQKKKKKNNYLKVQLFPRENSKGGRVELWTWWVSRTQMMNLQI